MRRVASSTITAIAIGLTLWLVWSKLRIVIFVHMPWWMLLLFVLIIFLVIEHLLSTAFGNKKEP